MSSNLVPTRLVVVGDQHISDTSPPFRKDDYWQSCMDKMAQVVGIAKRSKSFALVLLGDMFHSQYPGKTSHRTISILADILKGFSNVYTLVGNHDIARGRSAEKESPLNVLVSAGVVKKFPKHGVSTPDGSILYGFDYTDDLGSLMQDIKKLPLSPNLTIGFFHDHILPDNTQLPYKFYTFSELRALPFDVVISGHHHERYEPVKAYGKVWHNPGSLTRLVRGDCARDICVSIMEFAGKKLEVSRIKLISLDAEHVAKQLVDSCKLGLESQPPMSDIKKLVMNLGSVSISRVETVGSIWSFIETLDISSEARDRVRSFLGL